MTIYSLHHCLYTDYMCLTFFSMRRDNEFLGQFLVCINQNDGFGGILIYHVVIFFFIHIYSYLALCYVMLVSKIYVCGSNNYTKHNNRIPWEELLNIPRIHSAGPIVRQRKKLRAVLGTSDTGIGLRVPFRSTLTLAFPAYLSLPAQLDLVGAC